MATLFLFPQKENNRNVVQKSTGGLKRWQISQRISNSFLVRWSDVFLKPSVSWVSFIFVQTVIVNWNLFGRWNDY